MTLALAPFTSVVVGVMAATTLPRLAAVRYPGVESFCRWMSLSAMAAGTALSTCGTSAAIGCASGIVTQAAAWMVVRCWLPRESAIPLDETKLLQALAGLTATLR